MQYATANTCLCRKGESVVRIGNAKRYAKQDASSSGVRTRSSDRRCGRQSTRTEGRSLAQAARFGRKPVSVALNLCDCRSRRFEGVGKQVVSLRNAYLARAAGSRFVHCSCGRSREREQSPFQDRDESYLVDPASSHMLVSKIKPCMSKYKLLYCETANGSLNQLSSI